MKRLRLVRSWATSAKLRIGVAHAQPADLLEALGDLIRGAHEEAVGHAAGAVFGDVLGDAILQNWNNFLFPLVVTTAST